VYLIIGFDWIEVIDEHCRVSKLEKPKRGVVVLL